MNSESAMLPWDSPEFLAYAHELAARRLEFIDYTGKEILVVNYAGADLPLVRAIAAEVWHIVSSRKPGSMRMLNFVEGGEFRRESVNVLSELATKNRPFVLRSAVIGVTGMRYFAFQTLVKLAGRPIKLFEKREQALDWLARDD